MASTTDKTTQQISHEVGKAKCQTEEKTGSVMNMAGNAANSAKETVLNAGQQVKNTAVGVVETVKEKTGMNK